MQIGGRFRLRRPATKRGDFWKFWFSCFLKSDSHNFTSQISFLKEFAPIWPSGRSMPSVLPPTETKVRKGVKKMKICERHQYKTIFTLWHPPDQCFRWWSLRSSARQGTARCCSWCTSGWVRAARGRILGEAGSRTRFHRRPLASIFHWNPLGAPDHSPLSPPAWGSKWSPWYLMSARMIMTCMVA